MKKGFFLKIFIVLVIALICVFVMFLVDFNLIASGNNPKFCINQIEHQNQNVEYTGIGYKIIKYKIDEETQKLKVGTILLKYDESFVDSFKPKMDVRGYIREINNNGAYVIYVESTGYATKKYTYDKAYVTVSKETRIKFLENSKEGKKEDLKVGQVVEVSFSSDVQEELDPVRATAGMINIVQNVESEEQ